MAFDDDFFKKVEGKTKVDKNTIVSLASKLQQGNMKNPDTLKEVIGTLCAMTGKTLTKEREDKIISTIIDDKVPSNVDKLF